MSEALRAPPAIVAPLYVAKRRRSRRCDEEHVRCVNHAVCARMKPISLKSLMVVS
jgi:hypothetical protein